jgi:hypothetical protein
VQQTSRYSSVRLDIQSRATVGDKVKFTTTGSIGSTRPDWPNFTIGLAYHDGPVDYIRIVVYGREYTIRKGWALVVITRKVDPGTTLTLSGVIKFESTGNYELVGIAGYTDESRGGVVIDSSDPKRVEVLEPGIEFGGIRIPWWALALAGGCVAVISAVAVIAHIEHEKEMRMLMLLLSR